MLNVNWPDPPLVSRRTLNLKRNRVGCFLTPLGCLARTYEGDSSRPWDTRPPTGEGNPSAQLRNIRSTRAMRFPAPHHERFDGLVYWYPSYGTSRESKRCEAPLLNRFNERVTGARVVMSDAASDMPALRRSSPRQDAVGAAQREGTDG